MQTESIGDMVRHWRKVRRMSQMDLAAEAYTSTRHLSFVETGRARPSDDLVLRIAQALRLPLRHQNALLVASGYAPVYSAWSLDDDKTGMIRAALEHLLTQHEPFPAVVLDRAYDIILTNACFRNLVALLAGDDALERYDNMYKLIFSPDGLRVYMEDWEHLEAILLSRLHEESMLYQDDRLKALYAYCQQHTSGQTSPMPEYTLPVASFAMHKDGQTWQFFTAVTTFGTALDVTIEELRIESMFPADEATRRWFLYSD